MTSDHHTIIIGAGISGLTAAHFLTKKGLSVKILEPSGRAGGSLKSDWKDGFLLEHGPNTVMPNSDIMRLVEDLNLNSDMLLADPKSARYVLWNGALHAIPMSPPAMMKSTLLSKRGLLRLLAEPLIPRRNTTTEESLTEFSRRRLGEEATDRLLSPFVSGVWAGDCDQLSAEGAFPKLVAAENEKGSIVLGLLARRKKQKESGQTKPPKGLLSFKNGIETLSRRLADELGDSLHLNTVTEAISKKTGGWEIRTSRGTWNAKNVVFAQPAYAVADLISPLSRDAASMLKSIPYASLAVLHLGIDRSAVDHALNGFGYLIAPKEGSEVLGCLWNSSLFPRRVPDGQALLTVFIGGARHKGALDKSDEALFDAAFQSLNKTLGFRKRPRLLNLLRYERAIPQYTLGHTARVQALTNFESDFPGLHFAGNFLTGISVGDVIKNAAILAAQLT